MGDRVAPSSLMGGIRAGSKRIGNLSRFIRVRGHAKVMAHLMFGIPALTADQLLRFID